MPLTVEGFGPFLKGVVDGANPSLDNKSTLRSARHATLSGKGRLMAGPGSSVAITLMDDQGSPAPCTSVVLVKDFADGCLAIGHSTVTSKVYLYRLDSSLTGYWNLLGTVFTTSATAVPVGVLWAASPTAPACSISEVLNVGFIARTDAATPTTQDYATQRFDLASLATLTADLAGAGAQSVYALGTFSFHGHFWIWGYDKSAVPATGYRPELLRFGGPDGGLLTDDGKGTFTVGHKVRSAREAIVGGVVAGEVAYVGTTYSLWPIIGYGRDSWDKSHPLDESFGFIGLQCAVNAGGVLYYWSPRGPARAEYPNKPEPLWDYLPETIPTIVNPEKIVAAFDADRDQVLWYYRGGTKTGNQLLAAYDIRRDCFLGPDTDQGILVGCAGLVGPITPANAPPALPPAGPPTTSSTTTVGSSSAVANWVNGDTAIGVTTQVEYRQQGTTTWFTATTVGAGVTSATLTGLVSSTAYEWRAKHIRNAQSSTYLGPDAGSQFNTSATSLSPPTGCTLTDEGPSPSLQGRVEWTNSGESGVSTEVYLSGVLQTTVAPGVSSAYVSIAATGVYSAKVRHVKTSFTPSSYAIAPDATLTYSRTAF